jgi:hypothetical protein
MSKVGLERLEEGARDARKCGLPTDAVLAELPSDAVSDMSRSSNVAGACSLFFSLNSS